MPTAPTIVAIAVAKTTTSTVATPSLVLQVGDVVSAIAITEGSASGAWNAPSTTLSNSGISTLQTHVGGTDCGGQAFTFTVAAGTTTGTVTATISQASESLTLFVVVCRGASQPTASQSLLVAGSSRTTSYSSTYADSVVMTGIGDWAAAAAQSLVPTSSTHASGTPGPSAAPNSDATETGIYTHYSAVYDDQVSTSPISYGIGGTGTGPFTIVLIEIPAYVAPVPPDEGAYNDNAESDMWSFAGVGIGDGSF